MARKIICDRCGKECVNGHGMLHLAIIHATRDGDHVGEDDFRPLDLCTSCADEIRTELNFVMLRIEKLDSEAMVARGW